MSTPSQPRAGATRFALRTASRLAYDPGTKPDAADPAAVLLLHDLLADRGAFAGQQSVLAPGHRTILPDARGHGASASLANQRYTVAELAADVVAILDLEAVAAVHLVGHGLGGTTALELARRFPRRARSLTLIEPALAAVLDNDPDSVAVGLRNDLRRSDRAAADAAYKGLIDKSLDLYLSPRWGAAWRDDATKPRLGAIRRHAPALAGLLPALDAYTLPRPDARGLALPTLIIHGDDALPLDRAIAARLAALLPNARTIAFPFAPRVNGPFTTAPALTAAIAEFLADA